jgi:hypothetical protein
MLSQEAEAQVFGQSARTEFFGGFGIRVFYSHISKTQFVTNGDKSSSADTPNIIINAMPVTVVYGVSSRLSLIGVFPNIGRIYEQTVDGQRISESDFGLGDLMIFTKYRFYKKNRHLGSSQIAFQIGLKLPTGANDLMDKQGNRFPPPLQLGSGSIDYRLVLSLTEVRNRLFITSDFGYNLRTEANQFEFGDIFSYDAAIKFRLFPSKYSDQYPAHDFFVFLELNGLLSQKSKIGGNEIPDSGGHQIFLAPGFQFFPFENIIFESGIQLPILENLNGTQLGTDFQFRTGIRWII